MKNRLRSQLLSGGEKQTRRGQQRHSTSQRRDGEERGLQHGRERVARGPFGGGGEQQQRLRLSETDDDSANGEGRPEVRQPGGGVARPRRLLKGRLLGCRHDVVVVGVFAKAMRADACRLAGARSTTVEVADPTEWGLLRALWTRGRGPSSSSPSSSTSSTTTCGRFARSGVGSGVGDSRGIDGGTKKPAAAHLFVPAVFFLRRFKTK